MSMREDLLDREAQIGERLQVIGGLAAERELTPAETTEEDGLLAEAKGVRQKLDREHARMEALMGMRTRRKELEGTEETTDEPLAEELPADFDLKLKTAPKPLFRNFGEQLKAIKAAYTGGGTDERLLKIAAGPTGGSANVGGDFGFTIEAQWSREITKLAYEQAVLSSRCANISIGQGFDRYKYRYIEEFSRVTGSRWGGVQVFRVAEGETVTPTRPKMSIGELKLGKMMGLSYATEEEMEDAEAYGSTMKQAFSEEFAWMLDDEIVNGTGAGGECLGILNAGNKALVTVGAQSGQDPDTVEAQNIIDMWGRLPGRWRTDAAWFINQEIETQLPAMQIGTGASGQLVYMPPGGLSGQPYGTIYGRPVIHVEQLPKLGDKGDILLASLSQYLVISKGPMRSDMSLHVRFLNDEQTFRFIVRNCGMPKLKKSITPANASAGFLVSPFITLAAR